MLMILCDNFITDVWLKQAFPWRYYTHVHILSNCIELIRTDRFKDLTNFVRSRLKGILEL